MRAERDERRERDARAACSASAGDALGADAACRRGRYGWSSEGPLERVGRAGWLAGTDHLVPSSNGKTPEARLVTCVTA